jgi:hypothetical protein
LFSLLVFPRFARLSEGSPVLARAYFSVVAGLAVFFGAVVLFVSRAPHMAVWIFGPKYAGVEGDVVWICISACVGTATGLVYNLGAARGWIVNQAIFLPLVIGVQVALIPFLDFSRLHDVILFGLANATSQLCVHFAYGLLKLREIRVRR